jgi:hypothetical protein
MVSRAPVVFVVLSHHKLPLLERLLGRLAETDGALTVVHHDGKAKDRPRLPDKERAMFVDDPLEVLGAP